MPRSTRQTGAFIEKEFGLVYESRAGLIALLHRLGLEYPTPDVIPRKRAGATQKAFIASGDKLLNSLAGNSAVPCTDAVHPTHAAVPEEVGGEPLPYPACAYFVARAFMA